MSADHNQLENKAQYIDNIRRTIQELRDLPTLPTIATEIRRLASTPSSGISDLVEVIEEDLALTSRILRIANSAYYGVPRKIDNLKMALVVLGMNEISNLVMTITVMKLLPVQEGVRGFDIKQFWRHSAICAELTIGIYDSFKLPKPSAAYIAGLMHDIGKLVLIQYFHEIFQSCLQYSEERQLRMVDAELAVIGVDHGHVGSWLIRKWNIPDDISNAVAQHHVRPTDAPRDGLAAVIDYADRLAHILERTPPEEVIDAIRKDQKLNEWLSGRLTSVEDLIKKLSERMDRSLTMVDILQ